MSTEVYFSDSQMDCSCAICLESTSLSEANVENSLERSGSIFLPCAHLFHRSCAVQWLKIKASCPVCRIHVNINPIIYDNRVEGVIV